jgi:hypothetical protein
MDTINLAQCTSVTMTEGEPSIREIHWITIVRVLGISFNGVVKTLRIFSNYRKIKNLNLFKSVIYIT